MNKATQEAASQRDGAHARALEIHAAFNDDAATAPWLMCDRHPVDDVAFRFVNGDVRVSDMTYGELAVRSRRAAHFLAERGIGPGDRVASLLGKGPDLPALILGIWRLGAVYVPLFTAFAASAVGERISDADVARRHRRRAAPQGGRSAGAGRLANVSSRTPGRSRRAERRIGRWAGVDRRPPVSGPHDPIVQMATSGRQESRKSSCTPGVRGGLAVLRRAGLAPGEELLVRR